MKLDEVELNVILSLLIQAGGGLSEVKWNEVNPNYMYMFQWTKLFSNQEPDTVHID